MALHQRTRSPRVSSILALALASAGALGAGCATEGYVNKQVAASNEATDSKVADVRTDLDQVRVKADQAYDKATLAEKLATGMIETQEVAARDVTFAFDESRLDGDSQASLDELANQLAGHPRYVLEEARRDLEAALERKDTTPENLRPVALRAIVHASPAEIARLRKKLLDLLQKPPGIKGKGGKAWITMVITAENEA